MSSSSASERSGQGEGRAFEEEDEDALGMMGPPPSKRFRRDPPLDDTEQDNSAPTSSAARAINDNDNDDNDNDDNDDDDDDRTLREPPPGRGDVDRTEPVQDVATSVKPEPVDDDDTLSSLLNQGRAHDGGGSSLFRREREDSPGGAEDEAEEAQPIGSEQDEQEVIDQDIKPQLKVNCETMLSLDCLPLSIHLAHTLPCLNLAYLATVVVPRPEIRDLQPFASRHVGRSSVSTVLNAFTPTRCSMYLPCLLRRRCTESDWSSGQNQRRTVPAVDVVGCIEFARRDLAAERVGKRSASTVGIGATVRALALARVACDSVAATRRTRRQWHERSVREVGIDLLARGHAQRHSGTAAADVFEARRRTRRGFVQEDEE